MKAKRRTLLWFRGKDLRLSDHGALTEGLAQGEVVPLFVLDPYFFAPERAGELPHRIQFLLDSLASLRDNLAAKGGHLYVVSGRSVDVIPEIARLIHADEVMACRWSEPMGRVRDRFIASRLSVPLTLFEGETLLPPEAVRTQDGRAFAVYTPFSRAARKLLRADPPLKAPQTVAVPDVRRELRGHEAAIPSLESLGLRRNALLQSGGEKAARQRLSDFLKSRLDSYATARDMLAVDGTSRLSADLKFGTLSVRSVWSALAQLPSSEGRTRFEAELLWREFAYHNLWDRPGLLRAPFRADFRGFPYEPPGAGFDAWRRGATGYPVVDASAKQLLREGYVHNRARMISASFLTKHLLIDYRWGEAHYLKYLTDGDWAANNMGWQWSAGCGVDAAPYFRVFNPVTQGEKFDPEGSYVRRYLPELAGLPTRYLHAPWLAPVSELARAGVVLGQTYPEPIIDATVGRERFLATAKSHRAQQVE